MSKFSSPIVVLGARVVAGHPGALLTARLDKALRLAAKMPGVPVVVTGAGEAQAMGEYLLRAGLEPSRLVYEHEATSTNENLERVHALYPDAPVLHVVTNDFHCLRTMMWAWHLGICVKTHPACTPRRHRLRNYTRELVATPHSVARVVWRKLRT